MVHGNEAKAGHGNCLNNNTIRSIQVAKVGFRNGSEINFARLHGNGNRGIIRKNLEGDILDGSFTKIIIRIGLENDFTAKLMADKAIGAAADGIVGELFGGNGIKVGLGGNVNVGDVIKEGGVDRSCCEGNGVLINESDFLHPSNP